MDTETLREESLDISRRPQSLIVDTDVISLLAYRC